tara:strand:+ start:90 stop:941 length:852 start_codon:yes stop_codon:yes gene_type:complete
MRANKVKIVILTASRLRHKAFAAKAMLSKKLKVQGAFYEDGSPLTEMVAKRENNTLQKSHLLARDQAERDVFSWFLASQDKHKFLEKKVERGWFSSEACRCLMNSIKPDLILVYGTSILKGKLLEDFQGRILNIHLGLSPYYRGSGTNYFPFVNAEPEYCGATYMYLDKGIDTGEIIHQIRPLINEMDSFHQLSNRFLIKAFDTYIFLAENFIFDNSKRLNQDSSYNNHTRKLYKKVDFSDESLNLLHQNFKDGMIGEYLKDKLARDLLVPIIENPNYLNKNL